jgi:lipoate-protein ligase A
LPIASDIPSHCFATPAANDVLHPGGKKIAGAAMKRSRQGLLIQGSIDRSVLPKTFNFITFQKLLLKYLSSTLNLEPSELEDIRPLFKSEQIERERQRFAGDAWNRRR